MRDKIFPKNTTPSVAQQNASLIQTATRTEQGLTVENRAEGSQVSGNTLNANISLADRDFYFYMTLTNSDDCEIKGDTELEVDKVYFLYLSVSLNKSDDQNLNQKPIKIKHKIDFFISSQDFELLYPKTISFSLSDDLSIWKEKIPIFLKKTTQNTVDLQLDYQDGAIITGYSSHLSFKVNPCLESDQDSKQIRLIGNVVKAENIIILYVIPNGEKEWLIQGISPTDTIDKNVAVPEPNSDLKNFAKNTLGVFTKWLREAISIFPNVAISDKTPEQISWEMLLLKPGKYLGIEANVVRWIEQKAWGEKIVLDPAKKQTYQGQVISCISTEEKLINLWQTKLCRAAKENGAIALLNCRQILEKVNFEIAEDLIQERSLFIFANSPCSAKVHWKNGEVSGVVALALSSVFSSYLGLLTEVDASLSRSLQQKFLDYAAQEDGIQPGFFLRRLRLNYAQKYAEKKLSNNPIEQQKVEEILQALFSYVYYGCPNDVVKIVGGDQV